MKPLVVDILKDILDKRVGKSASRNTYRVFAKQLITLYRKGYVVFRVRTRTSTLSTRLVMRLNKLHKEYGVKFHMFYGGADNVKLREFFADIKERYTFWAIVRDEETLIKCYTICFKLKEGVLREIVNRIKSCKVIYYIL